MIEVQKLDNELGFRVSGDLLPQIYTWERSMDRMVFEEQIATGSFRGKWSVDPVTRSLMKKAAQAGKVMPYYGAGGSSGACYYQFQVDRSQCHFQVQHTVTGEVFSVAVDISKPNTLLHLERQPEMQFSPLPYITDEELSHPWTGARNQQLVCKIAGQEYANLKAWPNWSDDLALTRQYCYQFGQVSIGATGFCVKVRDLETGTAIDVTDYDSW